MAEMMKAQNISNERLVKNFDTKNKYSLDKEDFFLLMNLIKEKPNLGIFTEIWEVFNTKGEIGIKELKKMLQNE